MSEHQPMIVVTGAAGALGRRVIDILLERGVGVRGLGRGDAPLASVVPYTKADLMTGAGLAAALRGATAIVHAASDTREKGADVEVARNLSQAAYEAEVSHVVFVQIAGISEARKVFRYYEGKFEAEQVLRQGRVPCSTASATQFHHLVDRILRTLSPGPLLLLPKFALQPVDMSFFAERLADHAIRPDPGGITVCGPQTLTSRELATDWLDARALRKLVIPIPAFGPIAGFAKLLHVAGSTGGLPWADWLRRSMEDGSK